MAKGKTLVDKAIEKFTHPSGATADIPADKLSELKAEMKKNSGEAPQLSAGAGTHGKRYQDHPKFAKFKGEKS